MSVSVCVGSREDFPALVPGDVQYVGLRQNTKIVHSDGAKSTVPPLDGGYGVVPGAHTLVLDFDGTPRQVQNGIDEVSRKFDVDLTSTLTVRTPSGGCHMWLVFPEQFPLPDASKISELCEGVKGDVRSGRRFGYVVGPGSVVDGKRYELVNAVKPLVVTPDQANRLYNACPQKRGWAAAEAGVLAPTKRVKAEPTPAVVTRLERMLADRDYGTWHQKRAAVFAALSCCYDNDTIVKFWKTLDICRDTATGNHHLRHSAIHHDLKKLRPSSEHGAYCPTANKPGVTPLGLVERVRPVLEPSRIADYLFNKTRQSTDWKVPRVVNLDAVSKRLSSTRSSQRYVEVAFAIMESVVQPWLNFGVSNVLLGNAFLSSFLDATDLEVVKAKRLLLSKGVLQVSHKQYVGKTSAFRVAPEFVHSRLSKLLQAHVLGNKRTINIDWRTRVFVDPATGEVLFELARRVRRDLPDQLVSETVATKILQGVPVDFWYNRGYENYPFEPHPAPEVFTRGKADFMDKELVPEFWQGMLKGKHKASHPATFENIDEVLSRIFALDPEDGVPVPNDGYTPAVRCHREHLTFNIDERHFGMFRIDPKTQDFWNIGDSKPIWNAGEFLEFLLDNERELHEGVVRFWVNDGVMPVTKEEMVAEYAALARAELMEQLGDHEYHAWLDARDRLWHHDTTIHADGYPCQCADLNELRSEFGLPDYRYFKRVVSAKKSPRKSKVATSSFEQSKNSSLF